MKVLMSRVTSENGSKKGLMSYFEDDFDFEKMTEWVYRNCPANLCIKIEGKEVSAIYDDRIETYWIA